MVVMGGRSAPSSTEHREFGPGMARIHEVGSGVGHEPRTVVSMGLLDILGWAHRTLAPHIAWEDGWLYPDIDRRIGTGWATRGSDAVTFSA